MASSSSAFDVFLSFRGTDTRNNFTSHLFKALCDKNIKAFIDNNIERGEEITSFLEGIIECVKLSIIVFSSDYAASPYCLDEMVKIIECKETKAQIVLPIFYKVYPSEEIYKEAFARHEQPDKQEPITISKEMKVERWRSSFQKALGLAGWHIDDNRNEATVIEEIMIDVSKRLNCLSKGEELICTSLVGESVGNNFQKIWECLMNDEISRIGIYGMGGVGKTTIATRINNQLLKVDNSFTHIYWVIVSKDLSIYNLQSGIAKKIHLDLLKEDNERRRAVMIQKELINKKFLLILDDVWESFEIEDVGIPSLENGQKLLMTSRSRGVCERMECEPIEVKPLYEKEALDLFIKESKHQINDYLAWRDIVGSIVKECGGLPLAIVVIARRMRGVKEIWKWRDTLQELQKPCKGENPEIEEKVFKVLRFSYDHLPNDRCRQCFLYCSLFPEDHEFDRDYLIEYWIGEGLIEEPHSRQAELDKGNAILDELLHSSLLEMDFERIKMHDVIRDMACMTVKVGLHFDGSFESVQVPRNLKSFPNSIPHCSKFKTLLLQGSYTKEFPSCFFANMQSLNVLHMRALNRLKSIPKSISILGNLKVLIINDCDYMECIPSLAGLENLQHLNISMNENLKAIPEHIERLVNLRVLDLSINRCLSALFPIGVLEKLSHLQTLNLRGSGVKVEANALISLKKLQVLKVHFYNFQNLYCYLISRHWRRLLEYEILFGDIDRYWGKEKYLKTMIFHEIMVAGKFNDKFGMFLPDDIQHLQLLNWGSPIVLTVELAQHLLCNVQELVISSCHGFKGIIVEGEGGNPKSYINYPTIVLPNLKTLRLLRMPELKSIYSGMMVCPSLEIIEIVECNKIKRLPFCMVKEGNTINPTIKLEGLIRKEWWNSLLWDDHNAKLMYQLPKFLW